MTDKYSALSQGLNTPAWISPLKMPQLRSLKFLVRLESLPLLELGAAADIANGLDVDIQSSNCRVNQQQQTKYCCAGKSTGQLEVHAAPPTRWKAK
jgi:hypothetical protein